MLIQTSFKVWIQQKPKTSIIALPHIIYRPVGKLSFFILDSIFNIIKLYQKSLKVQYFCYNFNMNKKDLITALNNAGSAHGDYEVNVLDRVLEISTKMVN